MAGRQSFAALLVLLAATSVCRAQGERAELELYAGLYAPVESASAVLGFEVGSWREQYEGQAAAAVGARLTVHLTGTWAAEGTFLFTPSDLDDGDSHPAAKNLWAASGRLAANLGPGHGPVRYHLNAGVAVIGRGETVSSHLESVSIGGVIGAGARITVGQRTVLRLDIEDYIYSLGMDSPLLKSSERGFHDLVLSAGIVFPLRI